MQVIVNGKPVDELDKRLERQLTSGGPHDRSEGAVMGANEAVAATGRNLRILYSVVCGVAGTVMLVVLIGVSGYEPRDLIGLAPLVLVLSGALALLMRFTYRRNTAKVRQRASLQLPRMPRPGTAVVVDAAGLGIGADRHSWSALVIQALDVTATTFNDAPLNLIERLELDGGDGALVVLDAVLIRNGRTVVDDAWRRLRGAGG